MQRMTIVNLEADMERLIKVGRTPARVPACPAPPRPSRPRCSAGVLGPPEAARTAP